MNFLLYLFKPAPGPIFKFYVPLLILAGLLIIASIIASTLYKNKKKQDFAYKRLFKRLGTTLFSMGFLFLFLAAVRYENIPYFSMRVWIYLSFILLAYLTYRYIKIYKIDYPREKINAQPKSSGQKENSYLPNKKKKH